MIVPLYQYRAAMLPREKQVEMDGDTWWMDVDLGMRTHVHWKIRLHDYSCPERRESGGVEAKTYALEKLYAAKQIVLVTYKDRLSYDRWVADVYVDGDSLGPMMQLAGYATYTPM